MGENSARTTLPITVSVLGTLALFSSTIIAIGEVLLWWTNAGLALVLALSAAVTAVLTGWAYSIGVRCERRPIPGESLVWILCVYIVAMLRKSTFGLPDGSPHAISADAVHHGAIADWISLNERLPRGSNRVLGRLVEYPNGAHLLAATIAKLTSVDVWRIVGFLVIVLIMSLLAICGVIVSVMVERLSLPGNEAGVKGNLARQVGAVAVIPAWLLAHRFTSGIISIDFFFAQLVGFWIVAIALGCVATASRDSRATKDRTGAFFGFTLVALISFGSSLAYPLQVGLLPGALALVGVTQVWRARDRTDGARSGAWLLAAVLSVLSSSASILLILPRVQASKDMSAEEGQISSPSLTNLGGWLAMGICVVGLMMITLSIRRSRTNGSGTAASLVFVYGSMLMTAQAVVLMLVATYSWPVKLSRYTALKSVYVAVPFGLVVFGWTIGQLVLDLPFGSQIQPTGRRKFRYLSACLAFGFAWIPSTRMIHSRGSLSNASAPIMSKELLEFARTAANRFSPTDIGVIGDDVTPYAVLMVGLRSPDTPERAQSLYRDSPWSRWPETSDQDHLIVVGDELVKQFESRPGVRVVSRSKVAVLLERSK